MNSLKPTAIMKEKIWIKCMRRGFIPQLGMQGPIVTPVQITRYQAQQMIVAGIQVFEIDPKTKMVTELTLQNVYPGEGDPVQTKKEETPKPTAGVNSQPITPVNLQGVAAPIKEANGTKVDEVSVDKKTSESEEIKSDEVNKEVDTKSEEVAVEQSTDVKKDEETEEASIEKEENKDNTRVQNNQNGNNKNQKYKNGKKNK